VVHDQLYAGNTSKQELPAALETRLKTTSDNLVIATKGRDLCCDSDVVGLETSQPTGKQA